MSFNNAFLRVFIYISLFGLLGNCPVFGAGLKTLRGHLIPQAQHLTPIGDEPATNQLRLAIGLPLRNTNQLNQLLAEISDPASPNFRHFLTPEEFTARFGPTEADYAAVKNFARTNGFAIVGTHDNRLLLDVTAHAGDVERAFRLRLRKFRHPNQPRDFFAPDVEPTVDATLPIVDVSGLSDFSRPHPKVQIGKTVTAQAGSGSGGLYAGADFRNAYVPGTTLTGAGQMVGLLQFDGFYSNDITAYETQANLPSVPLKTVLLDSYDGTPTTAGNIEVSLDIEMAVSMAPGLAKIVIFEAGPTGQPNDVLNSMAASNTIKNLSCSWGWSGGPSATTENIFLQMAAQGQSFFNASGDNDAFTPGQVDSPGYSGSPASSPNITQVGGTTLTMNGSGASYASETVWNWGGGTGSSGGISSSYALPNWQQGISMTANGGSMTQRNIPDVALTADDVYVIYNNNNSGAVGGTSCAAPLWAGFMALVNQQASLSGKSPVGFINPAIYELGRESIYRSAFKDTTVGNNTSSASPNSFFAAPGYDLCTGLGTPGTNLINALLNPDPLTVVSNSGFNAVQSPAGTFNVSAQTFFLTNASAQSLDWSLINTSSWFNVSSSSGTLAAGGNYSVTVSLSSAASNLTPGFYTAGIWFSNLTSGVGHLRLFTLRLTDPLLISPTNNFSFIGNSGGPFLPAAQTIVLTNARATSLNWSLNNSSSWFTVSPASGTLAGGAQTNLTFTTTPAATGLANGIYNAVFQVTDLASQFVQPITGTLSIGQPLLQNTGFETGDFTGWTLVGDGFNFNYVDNGSSVTAIAPHSGSYFAALGEAGYLATLSQTLSTAAGQQYLISLWMNNLTAGNASSNPNEFRVKWNGGTLYDKPNMAATAGWTNLQFVVKATSTSTVLQIGGRDDKYYLGLDDVTVVPGIAPVIDTLPTNLTTITGGNASIAASVAGTGPLVYQWRKNNTNLTNGAGISGATSNILTLTAVTTNAIGNYSLFTTNLFGVSTSSVAALTVVTLPVISGSPTNRTVECGSNTVTYAINATGTPPFFYQWNLDGAPVLGATNANFALTNVHMPNHVISITVSNFYGSVTSNAMLLVQDSLAPTITLNGANPIFSELGAAFSDPGATATDTCAGVIGVSVSGSVNTSSTGTNLLTYTANDGNGNSRSLTRTVIVRDTTPPVIAWSFTNQIFAATNCSLLMPDVTGTNFIRASDLSGAVSISQMPTNSVLLPLGTNTVVITVKDASGNAAFSTNFLVVQDQTPPVILTPPQSQTNFIGSPVNFNVAATACTTVSYQWFFNETLLTNETKITLGLPAVTLASAGNYFVVASAAGGSTTSTVAVLTVNLIPPGINTVAADHNGFTVNLVGTPGYTYVLEATTNFISGWTPIATNVLGTNGLWQFTDPSATNLPQQFYRLKFAQ